VINRRKVGMTSSHHGPYDQGYTRATMARTEGGKLARVSESQKARRSPDWSLQLDSMKSESLVTVTPWEWVAPEVASLTFGRAVTTV